MHRIRDNKEHVCLYNCLLHNLLLLSLFFQILERTMHKYMAVIDVSEVGETITKTTTFFMETTTFIAMTSYLSSQVRELINSDSL